jgi:hypothetical protein
VPASVKAERCSSHLSFEVLCVSVSQNNCSGVQIEEDKIPAYQSENEKARKQIWRDLYMTRKENVHLKMVCRSHLCTFLDDRDLMV